MGRKKIEIKKISDEKNLLVTFAKRKVGLFNKACELSVLCDCNVAIIIFTNKSRLHHYASEDMDTVLKMYQECNKSSELVTNAGIIKKREKGRKKGVNRLQSDLAGVMSVTSNGDDVDGFSDDVSAMPDILPPSESAHYLMSEPMEGIDNNSHISVLSLDKAGQHQVPPQDNSICRISTSNCVDLFNENTSTRPTFGYQNSGNAYQTCLVDYRQPHQTLTHNPQCISTSIEAQQPYHPDEYQNHYNFSGTSQHITSRQTDPLVYNSGIKFSPDYAKQEPLSVLQKIDSGSEALPMMNSNPASSVSLNLNGCGGVLKHFQMKSEADLHLSPHSPSLPSSQPNVVFSNASACQDNGSTTVATTTVTSASTTKKPISDTKIPIVDFKNPKRLSSSFSTDVLPDDEIQKQRKDLLKNNVAVLRTPVFREENIQGGSRWKPFGEDQWETLVFPLSATTKADTSELPENQVESSYAPVPPV